MTTVDSLTDDIDDDFERGLAIALLEAADDDHVMGNRLCDWTGVAPTVEEDVSISNVAQDELGHAEGLYEEAADVLDSTLDDLAYGRPPEEYRNAQVVERGFEDWADTVVRQYFYDVADAIRFEALLDGDVAEYDESLAGYLEKVSQEEEYHTEHATVWLETLADDPDGKERVQRAIDTNWVDAVAFFEPGPHGVNLASVGVYADSLADQQAAFVDQVTETLTGFGYEVPDAEVGDVGAGRAGKHTEDLSDLLAETREVRDQGVDVPA